jgi:hypothetical protein
MAPPTDNAPTDESVPVEPVAAEAAAVASDACDAPDAQATPAGDAAAVEAPEAPAAGDDDEPAGDASADGPPKKRSRFGDAPEADAAPVDPLARARAIAERLGSAVPGKEGEPVEKSAAIVQVRKKVYMPADPEGKVNYVGLLLGEEGQSHKEMEAKSGAKVSE